MRISQQGKPRPCPPTEKKHVEPIGENTVLRRALDVAHRLEREQQLAVFDHHRSELVILNSTGGAFWDFLDGEATLGEIAAEMAESIQGAPSSEDILLSLIRLAEELLERSAVEIVRS